MRAFSVSYEVITAESAAAGDIAKQGMVDSGLTLREAIGLCARGPCEANVSPEPGARVRWVTFYQFDKAQALGFGVCEDATQSRSLHIPDAVTASSSRRIARLLHAHGWANRSRNA